MRLKYFIACCVLTFIAPIVSTLYYITTLNKSFNTTPALLNGVYGKINKVRKVLTNDKTDYYQLSFQHNNPTSLDVEELLFYPDNIKNIKTNNFEELISDNYCLHLTITPTKIIKDINLIQKNCE